MRLTSTLFRVGELTKKYSNLPEAYINKHLKQVFWKTPKSIQYLPKEIYKKKYQFNEHRPWTMEYYHHNYPGTHKAKVFVEPVGQWRFFKGDRVEILVGRDKGKQGHVIQIIQERNWVFVEGLNTRLKNIGESKDFPGILFQDEMPLLVTNEVALVDPADMKPTKAIWRYTEEGEKVRVSERTGRIIPIPKQALETMDYKLPSAYQESAKDTKEEDLSKITFKPELKTFEMDILDEMGIKEDRIPRHTFWY